MENPIISIIIPVYNAESYINKTIDSVLGQTFKKFELILIDDASTDSTLVKISQYDDSRIVKKSRQQNSGSAYLPREDGIKIARGDWILNLDADDYISKTYLEALYDAALKYDVEVCTSQMIVVDCKGKELGFRVPNDNYDYNVVKKGRNSFELTVPYWTISMAGALVKRSLWQESLVSYFKEGKREIHDDENLSRLILLKANTFISVKETYFARSNSTSITGKFSLSTFGWMFSNKELKEIACKYYGENSKEHIYVEYYDFLCYKSVMQQFVRNAEDCAFKESIRLAKKWHANLDWSLIKNKPLTIKETVFKWFTLSLLISAIKYRKIKFFITLH